MLMERIVSDIKSAMKKKEKAKLLVLRSLKSALKNKEIEVSHVLSDDEVIDVLHKAVKSREQSVELYLSGERADLAEKEKFEILIIKEYLPKNLEESEILKIVVETIEELKASSMKDMGKVMGAVSKKTGKRADGKIVSKIVKDKLK